MVLRGAERFLTARDQRVLATTSWAKSEPFGLGNSPTALVIDDYYAALGVPRQPVEEAVRTWPAACGETGWKAIDRTVELLAAARRHRVPIVYATGFPQAPNPWNRKPATANRVRATTPEPNQIVAEVAPQPGDIVLEKATPSVFAGTPLNTILRARGCDTLVVCGESTSGCVRSTVVDACVLGYAVAVVQECCFDRFEASHWINLFDLDQKYSDVMSLAEVVGYLDALAVRDVSAPTSH